MTLLASLLDLVVMVEEGNGGPAEWYRMALGVLPAGGRQIPYCDSKVGVDGKVGVVDG